MTDEENKICRICGKTKPLSEYPIRTDSGKHRNDCRDCCNKRYHEWRLSHKERAKELRKKYYDDHKEELDKYYKNYQRAHLDKFRQYNKKYRDNLSDEQKAHVNERSKRLRKKWRENPEYVKKVRQWNRESSLRRRKKITAYEEDRKRRDPVFKLKKQIRGDIRAAFKRRGFNKSEKTENIVGCSIDYLQRHLRMTYLIRYGEEWDGVTRVHIDHIRPLVNAHTIEETYALNNWNNLQLLREEDNLAKADCNEPDSWEQFLGPGYI